MITLEIVTPKGRALSAEAEEVVLPSANGDFGVLAGHLPTLAAMRPGILTYRAGTTTHRCAVAVGFVEVATESLTETKVSVLTQEYTVRDDVDPVIARTALKEVQADIAKTEATASDPTSEAGRVAAAHLVELIARENWLAAQLELYGDPPPATMRPHEQYGPSPIDDSAPDEEPPPETASAPD